MARRFPVNLLAEGDLSLDPAQSRHVRDILRMEAGDEIELFDPEGRCALAIIQSLHPAVRLRVASIQAPLSRTTGLVIASAIPKGNRADWMIEKLSELDAGAIIPLECDRSVVHPESGKLQRFGRIASESAKQCRRRDVLRILPVQNVQQICADGAHYAARWHLTTEGQSRPAGRETLPTSGQILAVVGPEGGWTDRETALFDQAHFQAISLGPTILRIETAAMAIAALILARQGPDLSGTQCADVR